uniref:HTH_11 domain-containing protein n=1 Tax=Strongyloides papillosus TaxID=174720 RepID=A0A0N5C9H1_STREA
MSFKGDSNAAKTTQEINGTFGKILKFKEGNKNLENEERGRPGSVLSNDNLRKAVVANPRTTVRELAEALNVSKSTISNHLKEIEETKKLDQ